MVLAHASGWCRRGKATRRRLTQPDPIGSTRVMTMARSPQCFSSHRTLHQAVYLGTMSCPGTDADQVEIAQGHVILGLSPTPNSGRIVRPRRIGSNRIESHGAAASPPCCTTLPGIGELSCETASPRRQSARSSATASAFGRALRRGSRRAPRRAGSIWSGRIVRRWARISRCGCRPARPARSTWLAARWT